MDGDLKEKVLVRLYAAVHGALTRHPLALIKEGFLETIAKDAALRSGASIIEPSGRGGSQNVISMKGELLHQSVRDKLGSLLGCQNGPGRPPGEQSPDVWLLFPDNREFRLELKVRCRFSSSNSNASGPIVKDLCNVVAGERDAFLLAADREVYERIHRAKKRGKRRSKEHELLLTKLLPENPDSCIPQLNSVGSDPPLFTSVVTFKTCVGMRIVVVVAREPLEWVVKGRDATLTRFV